MPPLRQHRRGFGTLFVILGIVAVFGGTFMAGFLSGRHWERVRVVAGLVKPQAGQEPARERAGASAIAQPPLPSLTFYQELTAPLSSPPPRGAKGDTRTPRAEPARPELPRADAARTEAPKPEAKPEMALAKADAAGSSYAVQVAAYATRAQAEALAGRLTARGFAADVSETTTQNGVRYRVRFGAYPTREVARDALARLATDVHLSGFVTTR
jgi:cell division septation protein DedD